MALQSQLLSGALQHYYLCHYKSKAAGSDRLSQSLLRFKSGCEVDVEAWSSCIIEELKKFAWPENTLLLRALASNEVTIEQPTSLDRVGDRLRQELKFQYEPHLLSKAHVTPPLKQLSRNERHPALVNTYRFHADQTLATEWSTILILDDILTTGTTLKAIAAAIRQQLPDVPITGLTLALSEKTAPLNATISLQSNAYTWQQPGSWVMRETDPDYISLESLLTAIQSDFQN